MTILWACLSAEKVERRFHALTKFVLISEVPSPILPPRLNHTSIAYRMVRDIGGIGQEAANDWVGQNRSLTTLPASVPRYTTLHMGTGHDRNFCLHVLMNHSWRRKSLLACTVIPDFLLSRSTGIGNLFPWIAPEVKYPSKLRAIAEQGSHG